MAPLKTYLGKKATTNFPMKNITKRVKKDSKKNLKTLVKKVLPVDILSGSSLNLIQENTFDRLVRGPIYNPVNVQNIVKNFSSDSEFSKLPVPSISIESTRHSPIMTRSRSRSKASAVSERSLGTLFLSSLIVEKEGRRQESTCLSYIKIPNLNVFSKTFHEKQSVLSSTPFKSATQRIIDATMSPISTAFDISSAGSPPFRGFTEAERSKALQVSLDMNNLVKSPQPDAKLKQPVVLLERLPKSEEKSKGFIESPSVITISDDEDNFEESNAVFKTPFQPGKLYKRDVSLARRSTVHQVSEAKRRGSIILPVAQRRTSVLNKYAHRRTELSLCNVQEELPEEVLEEKVRDLALSAKEIVLRRCGQKEVLEFNKIYTKSLLKNCQKIGEGIYGEVFLYRTPNGATSVMKIIPVDGELVVNGEKQKKYDEILSEIVIAMEVSNLRRKKKNQTASFSELKKVHCVRGTYPSRLQDLWELYAENKGSENDSPAVFPEDQEYIVLEFANGGDDLESFVFEDMQQAYSIFQQTACALAVAEQELKFEHRDLHWGNILLRKVDKTDKIAFSIDGREVTVETAGVLGCIIDFTLSRMEFEGVVIFTDLSVDETLFTGAGDYQFDIYRLMKDKLKNNWQEYEPFTNVLWLHYLLEKLISGIRLRKRTRSKINKEYSTKLQTLKDIILNYSSVCEFIKDLF